MTEIQDFNQDRELQQIPAGLATLRREAPLSEAARRTAESDLLVTREHVERTELRRSDRLRQACRDTRAPTR